MTDPWLWSRQQGQRAPKTSRRKHHRPLSTKHPTCRDCGEQVWPGHECQKED